MKKAKYNTGDIVLIKIRSDLVGQDVWVGHIIGMDRTSYAVKTLSTEAAFMTKIPFLFDHMMQRVEVSDLERTIKLVKLLYYD